MNIILVSSRLPTAKTLILEGKHVLGGCFVLMVALLVLAALMNYATLRYVADNRHVRLFSLSSGAVRDDSTTRQAYLRENLDAMAVRLGELQARILRLDALGERVAKSAGFKPQDFALDRPVARGGAIDPSAKPLSLDEFSRHLDVLSRQVEERGDRLGLLDSMLMRDSVQKQLLPSVLPVEDGVFTSHFGWRLDPFNGHSSFHEGMDFMAVPGTPIVAAAAGVVVASEHHPQYGKMVEIDHGNGLTTRYAHCSRLLAKVGDVVMRGAAIGEVGSSGRATGPHLHFEVRHHGVAQNPARFLRISG